MVNTTDIDELIARAQSTFEGVPRNRLAWELAGIVVRQQAVVEAARVVAYHNGAISDLIVTLAALDAPPEGDG